jgi:hypothetical protein
MITFGLDPAPASVGVTAPVAVDVANGLPPAVSLGRDPMAPLFTALAPVDPTKQPAPSANKPGFVFTLFLVAVLIVFAFRRR